MTGTVGHDCCKALGGYLLFGSIFILAGRCSHSRWRTNDGSCRAGRAPVPAGRDLVVRLDRRMPGEVVAPAWAVISLSVVDMIILVQQ